MSETLSADRVVAELDQLWASLAAAGSKPDSPGVLRACAMSLFVLQEEDAAGAAPVAQTIAEVMRAHPNRAVIVSIRNSMEPLIEHRVTAQCWVPFGGRQQLCCEQIEITVSSGSLEGVVPVLLAIAAPDVPLVVWCRSAKVLGLRAVEPLLERASKAIVDPSPLEDLARQAERGFHVADLSWTHVTRWREIVAQIFEDPARQAFVPKIRQITVMYSGGEPPAAARYLAAWVSTCANCRGIDVRFEKSGADGGSIEGIVMRADSHTVSIRRATDTAVLIEVDSLKSCAEVPRHREAELLGAELSISGRDTVFERVLPLAASLK